jgi:glycosyltransferase involved in cell wall biosynthesis
MPFTLERVDSVLTVSEFTAGELETFYGYPRECIRVTPLGVDSRFVPSRPDKTETVRMRYRLPRRYVLFVGTIEPRKNLSVLIKAYKLLQKKGGEVPGLVLVGADGWRGEAVKINRLIARFGLEGSVIRLGYVREEDLPALYGAADIFVFPSLYEGFGLPPLEAMACGTPVISSNAASLPEVLGDAALYVSPEDTNALAEAMARLLCDDELQNSMIDKGRDRAKRFTWPETARSTLCIYREVCSR